MVELQEDFITGAVSSGTIGTLGWTSAGTITAQLGEANRPGILRLDTTAVAATVARIGIIGSAIYLSDVPHQITWAARLNTNDANTTVRIGEMNANTANPPTSGIYLEKLDGDTNWFCVARSAGVQTRTDSTIAVSTSFVTLFFSRDSSGVQYQINGTSVCSTISTNVPTGTMAWAVQIVNSAAAAKTLDVDYTQFSLFGLVR